jgi:predicted nucleic acid-binding protein
VKGSTVMEAVFVDTWAWIELASADDQYHLAATAQHRRLRRKSRPYVTSDDVLSEVITHLYRKQDATQAESFINGLFEAFDKGAYRLIHVSVDQFRKAWLMRNKYRDKPDISFVDFTSMVVMQDGGASRRIFRRRTLRARRHGLPPAAIDGMVGHVTGL